MQINRQITLDLIENTQLEQPMASKSLAQLTSIICGSNYRTSKSVPTKTGRRGMVESKKIHKILTSFETDLKSITSAKSLSKYINYFVKKGHSGIANLSFLKRLVSLHSTYRTRNTQEFHKRYLEMVLHSIAIETYNRYLSKIPMDTRAFVISYIPSFFIFRPDALGNRFNPQYKRTTKYMLTGSSKAAVMSRDTNRQGRVLGKKGKLVRPKLFSLVTQRRGVVQELFLENAKYNLSKMLVQDSSATLVMATNAWDYYFKDIKSRTPKTVKIVDIINKITMSNVAGFTQTVSNLADKLNKEKTRSFKILTEYYKQVLGATLKCLQQEVEKKLGKAFELRDRGYTSFL